MLKDETDAQAMSKKLLIAALKGGSTDNVLYCWMFFGVTLFADLGSNCHFVTCRECVKYCRCDLASKGCSST